MNAPARSKAPQALTLGQVERMAEIRELIHAQMYFVKTYAAVVEYFAEAGDDAGITYGLEKLAIYTRTALELRFNLETIRCEPAKSSEPAA